MNRSILFFVIAVAWLPAFAQKSIRDSSITLGHLSIVYALGQPGGDLNERFGFTNQVGGEAGVKFASNFYAYSGMKFIFGNVVKEPVARNVIQVIGSDSLGYQTKALGADGRFYPVRIYERGIVIPFVAGKIFRLSHQKNLNSGIYVEAGGQFIQHKISINDIGDNVPYLAKEYLRGYDRLSNGFGLVEGVGYRHFGRNRFTNFFVGLEFSQSFTRNRRLLNFDTGVRETELRHDLLYNLKVGWTFPIYKSAPESEYYY